MAPNSRKGSQPNRKSASHLDRRDVLLLEEYKNCTRLLMNENRIFWSRFQTFFAICTAFFPIWIYLASQNPSFTIVWATEGTAILGIALSFLWLLVVIRGRGFNAYWQIRLGRIEYLLHLRTFNRADERRYWARMRRWRKVGIGTSTKVVAIVFMAIWVILIITYLPTFLQSALNPIPSTRT